MFIGLETKKHFIYPVTLSNDWVKPFGDVVDWSSVVVDGDERLLLQLPDLLRSFDRGKLEQMRAQSLAIYENYFSSLERIVSTTTAILTERIQSHLSLTSFLWNSVNPGFTGFTGAIWFDTQYSQDIADYPGYRYRSPLSSGGILTTDDKFTCTLFVNRAILPAPFLRLIRSISKAKSLAKVS